MQCCICLGDPVFALETNCGHVYCGEDFFEFFRRVDTGVLRRNLNSNIFCDFISNITRETLRHPAGPLLPVLPPAGDRAPPLLH